MAETKPEDLRKAYKREKDPRVRARMVAVNSVCILGDGVQDTADRLMQSPDRVSHRVKRFEEGGIDALRDLPRTGRPPAVQAGTMDGFMAARPGTRITPARMRREMREELGAAFHIGHVRRIMREYGMTPKTAQMIHVNHATAGQVEGWQYRLKDRLARLRSEGFTIVTLDEAFFVYDTKAGRKYWSLAGTRIAVPYTGSHRRIAVYGAVTEDGRQMFCTHPRLDGRTFISYVRALRRRRGRAAVLCDRASPHRTRELRRFARECGDVEMVYLPRGSPYLNPVEACWQRGKSKAAVAAASKMLRVIYWMLSEKREFVARYGQDCKPRTSIEGKAS